MNDAFCCVYCRVFGLPCPCDAACQANVDAAIQGSPVASHMLAMAKAGGLNPAQLIALIMTIVQVVLPLLGG